MIWTSGLVAVKSRLFCILTGHVSLRESLLGRRKVVTALTGGRGVVERVQCVEQDAVGGELPLSRVRHLTLSLPAGIAGGGT